MKLKLTDIIGVPGASLRFDYNMDLSDLEINFVKPFANPVHVTGEVRNIAGVLELSADAGTVMVFNCDRCAERTEREECFEIDAVLVEELENPEDIDNADMIVIENAEVDVDAVVRDAIILESDMQFLCSDDCKGLCPRCGKNLNEGPCSCEKETDPRLEALRVLLDRE